MSKTYRWTEGQTDWPMEMRGRMVQEVSRTGDKFTSGRGGDVSVTCCVFNYELPESGNVNEKTDLSINKSSLLTLV